jgi:LacI family transcriptional regulator
VPYVCINERAGTPVAQVLADDVKGARLAVEHLHQLGHRRIAYGNARATYLTHYSVAERYETVVEAARKHRMALAAGHDVPFSSAEEFLRESVVKAGATAVVTYDHRIAVALVGAAYGMDLRIPRDFSLICFNDLFPVSLMPPPLTAITVPGQEMGRLGADLLLNSLGSEGAAASAKEVKEIRVPEHLVVRESTAAPPGR